MVPPSPSTPRVRHRSSRSTWPAQGLRHGDCDLALVGGVNLILSPELNVNFCKASMMSRDGRCRTFDAGANGYVRGEGGGIIVLRRLRDAVARGDRILAVVRGTAINQDGRSNGLTAPNGPAQQEVIRAALADAAMPPRVVGYVEAHGTGTPLGDPIEVGALAAVLSEGRDATSPVALGSVKTNVGHLEAAAGIAGVIKTVIALERREIPPHLHLQTPNPFIDWKTLSITIPERHDSMDRHRGATCRRRELVRLQRHERARHPRSGAGTFQRSAAGAGSARAEQVLALSARDPQALHDLGRRYHDAARQPGPMARRRHRATSAPPPTPAGHILLIVCPSWPLRSRGLRMRSATGCRERTTRASCAAPPDRVAQRRGWPFSFQGRDLSMPAWGGNSMTAAPEFRQAFDECAVALEPLLGCPLGAIVFPDEGRDSLIDQTTYAQPAMFAIEYALAALWRSWGVEPVAVMGHSFGEYAAACVAGLLSLDDAREHGRRAWSAWRESARRWVDGHRRGVGRRDGRGDTIGRRRRLDCRDQRTVQHRHQRRSRCGAGGVVDVREPGRRTTPLRVSHAFHSPLMDPVLDDFEREIATVHVLPRRRRPSCRAHRRGSRSRHYRACRVLARSPSATGPLCRRRCARSPSKGITHYVEMSPHSVLLGMGADCVAGGDMAGVVAPGAQRVGRDAAEPAGALRGRRNREVAERRARPVARRSHCRPTRSSGGATGWRPSARRRRAPDKPIDFWSTAVRVLDRESARGPLDLDPGVISREVELPRPPHRRDASSTRSPDWARSGPPASDIRSNR